MRSSQQAGLIRGNHVFDVDECVLSAMGFENLQSLVDKFTDVSSLTLRVVHLVEGADCAHLEDAEDRQDLPIIRNKSLTNHFPAQHKCLKDLQRGDDDLRIPGVQRSLDGHDKLGHNRQDLAAPSVEEIENSLHGQKPVRILLLSKPVKEDRQVMVIVQLIYVHLPLNLVLRSSVLNLNRQISPVVEAPEFRWLDRSAHERPSFGRLVRDFVLSRGSKNSRGLSSGSFSCSSRKHLLDSLLSRRSRRWRSQASRHLELEAPKCLRHLVSSGRGFSSGRGCQGC
mmetsp:Transcript_51705/g.83892  ORF Transcript_51705/g.83892 Transcript_51705/m.83892 type:complete len:283 (+) Transcript_51705:142-990(+)